MEQKENQSNKRRKIVLGLAGGIAGATQVKEAWFKPVINAVVLPAHAQTTVDPDAGAGAGEEETEVVLQSLVDCEVTEIEGVFTASGTLTSLDPADDLSGYEINLLVESLESVTYVDTDPDTGFIVQPPTEMVPATAMTTANGSFSSIVPLITSSRGAPSQCSANTIEFGFTFQVEGEEIECSMPGLVRATCP